MIVWEREHVNFAGGRQVVHRFDNNYGASVITGNGSYTNGGKNSFELAVVRFDSEDNEKFELDYTTGITEDVIGNLTIEEVDSTLDSISKLKDNK